MLAHIQNARSALTPGRMDLHRHAQFSCMLSRLANKVRGLFTSR